MTTDQFMALCDGVAIPPAAEAKSQNANINIRDALSDKTNPRMSYQEVIDLRTGFIYLSIIDVANKDKYADYYYILEDITTNFNDSVKEIASWSEQVWKDVIAYIKQHPSTSKTNAFYLEDFRKQERERALAAKRLTKYGLSVTVANNDLHIDNEDVIVARIESLMTTIGGENAINMLIRKSDYNSKTGRIDIKYQGNTPIPSMVEPELPWGYLFNLCVKHLKDTSTSVNLERDYNELAQLATDLCLAVYDVQKFDIWSDVTAPSKDIIDFMQRLVLRFDIYTLPQTGASFTSAWCKYLSEQIKKAADCSSLLRQELDNTVKAMNWYICNSKLKECVRFKKRDKRCSLLASIPHPLAQRFITKVESINSDFKTPIDFTNVNYMFHPLYCTEDEIILLPTSLGVWNWYETIYNIIKAASKTLAGRIGYIMEDFIRLKLQTHGIVSHTGEYTYDKITGEVDILVEAESGDALIESKKKDLSRNARKGDNHFIWGDLFEILESQMQCARTENGVRNYGSLTLAEKVTGQTYAYTWKPKYQEIDIEGNVKLRDRIISRITMTLKEYGPMQDKMIVSNIIRNLIGKKIDSTFSSGTYAPDDIKNFKSQFFKINKVLAELTDYYQAINLKDPTFFCRFYSMEQLYYIIRTSSSADDFFELVAKDNVSMGTENFWNEIECTRQLCRKE